MDDAPFPSAIPLVSRTFCDVYDEWMPAVFRHKDMHHPEVKTLYAKVLEAYGALPPVAIGNPGKGDKFWAFPNQQRRRK